jgi:type I restriction enzyme R subunit
MNENEFENELIQYLTTGTVTGRECYDGIPEFLSCGSGDRVIKTKLWKYEPSIKTTAQLWNNFKEILEQHNQNVLNQPLSTAEFNQVKKIISDLHTPYDAGRFLYGLNGVTQIEIDLDDGRHVFLTVFDQKQIGAGDTVYQIVNQIERPAIIPGKMNRRFDTTLLINGLPIIQIEEKTDSHDVNESLNQMHQYIDECQYGDIFSVLQILVAMTPNNIRYMANTTSEMFNKDFAFNWQRKTDSSIVRNWKEFADSMLSIPMAHQMATNYMILDGTINKQSLMVMRPYQVYATQNVIEGLKKADFDSGINKIGYIWHTTGSGKTVTSFKTAWLASRMPKVDKVVFVVDRIQLTKQTNEKYRAYDPDSDDKKDGVVQNTSNTKDLNGKLKSKSGGIIVTSVQKLDTLVKRKNFKDPDKNIVFIVDEAHRSTGGESFEKIQKSFKHAAWIGYTGTPMFDDTTPGLRTEDIFGNLLHAYTIREAIADRNVLGFKVDFETTIPEEEMKKKYLPAFFKEKYPDWTEEKIEDHINNLSPEDMDDAVGPTFYDENSDHVRLVVKDIFDNWQNRSNEGRYNALLTTHVGGNRASTPMAMMYFDEFRRVNRERQSQGLSALKVAVTFSSSSSNDDNMLATNKGLFEAIKAYNEEFHTAFNMADVSGYTQDVISRLNKTASDGVFLDLVIVVDQLLTGFDAPELNTLYVDRTLKGAGLIQAYSRTNRISDMQEKPWGRIVNYRWPAHNERLMNEALAVYANKDSSNLSDEERSRKNVQDGITAPNFEAVLEEVRTVVKTLSSLTNEFQQMPSSEKQKDYMINLIRDYNAGMAKLKQYDYESGKNGEEGYDYNKPDDLIKKVGMTPEQEKMLTTVLANELKSYISEKNDIPVYQIDLRMTHIKDIKVDYDYLTELINQLLNAVHEGKEKEADEVNEKINQFAKGMDDRVYAGKVINAAKAIRNGDFPSKDSDFTYPAQLQDCQNVINLANNISVDRVFLDFRGKWGITDIITSAGMRQLFSQHRYGEKDLDGTGIITEILTKASLVYNDMSLDKNVQSLSKIKYRNSLREAIYKLADHMSER